MVSLDSNLASHSYRFSNIELSVSGVEDSHIMLQFDAEVDTIRYLCVITILLVWFNCFFCRRYCWTLMLSPEALY